LWGFWFAQKKRVLKIKVLKPVDEIMLNKKSRAKFLLDGFFMGLINSLSINSTEKIHFLLLKD